MRQVFLSTCLSLALLTGCSDTGSSQSAASVEASSDIHKLAWEDLIPEGEEERLVELYKQQAARVSQIEEGSLGDVAVQLGSYTTVPKFEGRRVRLPGYTVPFEYGVNAKITEFLLVPYYGACLHAPPPPPNQTIYVKTSKPIQLADLAQAVWIEGTLRATKQETALADAAYTIEMDVIETY